MTDQEEQNSPETEFYPLTRTSAQALEQDVQKAELEFKTRWFAYNGGKPQGNTQHQKPLFFDVALNYVELPMERLQEKAGIVPAEQPAKVSPVVEKRALVDRKVDAQPEEAPAAPVQQESQGVLGTLLGGWWGRK